MIGHERKMKLLIYFTICVVLLSACSKKMNTQYLLA